MSQLSEVTSSAPPVPTQQSNPNPNQKHGNPQVVLAAGNNISLIATPGFVGT